MRCKPFISKHPNYSTWLGIIKRTSNPAAKDIKYYKHITVSASWRSFWNFNKDMGNKPSKAHSIDRIDNSKGYCKENCRWATKKEQIENRSTKYKCRKGHLYTEDNIYLTHNGKYKTKRCKKCYEEAQLKRNQRRRK